MKAKYKKPGPRHLKRLCEWRYTFHCRRCNKAKQATVGDILRQITMHGYNFVPRCPDCSETHMLHYAVVPPFVQQAVRAGWGRTCRGCQRPLREHLGDKCLFDGGVFDGRAEEQETVLWRAQTWSADVSQG